MHQSQSEESDDGLPLLITATILLMRIKRMFQMQMAMIFGERRPLRMVLTPMLMMVLVVVMRAGRILTQITPTQPQDSIRSTKVTTVLLSSHPLLDDKTLVAKHPPIGMEVAHPP